MLSTQVPKLLSIKIYTTLNSTPQASTNNFAQVSLFIYFLKCISDVIF